MSVYIPTVITQNEKYAQRRYSGLAYFTTKQSETKIMSIYKSYPGKPTSGYTVYTLSKCLLF